MYLNCVLLNARSLLKFERRRKFVSAVSHCAASVHLVTETWLNDQIEDTELMLLEYSVYRADRKLTGNTSNHGGVLIAVRDCFNSYKLNLDLPECALAVQIEVNNFNFAIFCAYNPP